MAWALMRVGKSRLRKLGDRVAAFHLLLYAVWQGFLVLPSAFNAYNGFAILPSVEDAPVPAWKGMEIGSITVKDEWTGLFFRSPGHGNRYVEMTPQTDGSLSGQATNSLGVLKSVSTNVSIPAEIASSFYSKLQSTRFYLGRYTPTIYITDNYPYRSIALRGVDGRLIIEYDSMSQVFEDRAPWGAKLEGVDFTVKDNALHEAFELLRAYFQPSEQLKRDMKAAIRIYDCFPTYPSLDAFKISVDQVKADIVLRRTGEFSDEGATFSIMDRNKRPTTIVEMHLLDDLFSGIKQELQRSLGPGSWKQGTEEYPNDNATKVITLRASNMAMVLMLHRQKDGFCNPMYQYPIDLAIDSGALQSLLNPLFDVLDVPLMQKKPFNVSPSTQLAKQ